MDALVLNMPQFPGEVVLSLLEDGFLFAFADFYPSFEDPEEPVLALAAITETVAAADWQARSAFLEALAETELLNAVDARNEEVGDPHDDEEIRKIRQAVTEMQDAFANGTAHWPRSW
jgi:HEAT repeat protein